jgi:hypothetical protein
LQRRGQVHAVSLLVSSLIPAHVLSDFVVLKRLGSQKQVLQ